MCGKEDKEKKHKPKFSCNRIWKKVERLVHLPMKGKETKWQIIGASKCGTLHIRAGLPNQDAIYWLPKSGSGLPLVLAVSDGHGSPKSFRSHIGAQFAVEVAVSAIWDFLNKQRDFTNLSAIKRIAEERLPQEIVRKWKEAIEEDIQNNPIIEDLKTLEEKEGISARRVVESNLSLIYGATILAVAITESFIIYLHLGDGDILSVSESGEVSRPVPKDERLFGNETTSLCLPDAWREFRAVFQVILSSSPALILLATDGYANSFREEEDFLKVGSDILAIIREKGLDYIKEKLDTWLREASERGSGDDITVGIIYRSTFQENKSPPIFEKSLIDRARESTLKISGNNQERGENNA